MPRIVSAARPRQNLKSSAFSQMEVLIVVAILGLLAAVAIPLYEGVVSESQAVIANNVKETLNLAVHRFNEANYECTYPTNGTGTELIVLRGLQYRNAAAPATGSPYIRPDWIPVESSSLSDYRIAWQGTLFTLISPGTAGTGLRVAFDGSDLGTNVTFPVNYTPMGE